MNSHRTKAAREWQAERAAQRAEIAHAAYRERLISCHGPERAQAILDGRDEAFNADVAKWRNIGRQVAGSKS